MCRDQGTVSGKGPWYLLSERLRERKVFLSFFFFSFFF